MNNPRKLLEITQDAAFFSAWEFFRPLVVIYRAVRLFLHPRDKKSAYKSDLSPRIAPTPRN